MTILTEMERKVLNDIANERDPRVELGDILNTKIMGSLMLTPEEPGFPAKSSCAVTFPDPVFSKTYVTVHQNSSGEDVVFQFLASGDELFDPTYHRIDIPYTLISGAEAVLLFIDAYSADINTLNIRAFPDTNNLLIVNFEYRETGSHDDNYVYLHLYDAAGLFVEPMLETQLIGGKEGLVVPSGTLVLGGSTMSDLYVYIELNLPIAENTNVLIPMWIKFTGAVHETVSPF